MSEVNLYLIFIAIATSITIGTEGLKLIWGEVMTLINAPPKIKNMHIGIFFSLILSYWGIFAYGKGLLLGFGLEYTNPTLRAFDLFTTAAVVSLGSAGIYSWLQAIKAARENQEEE